APDDFGAAPSALSPAPPAPAGVDRARLERGFGEVLAALGADGEPSTIAATFEDLTAGMREDPTRHLSVRFEADHDELVLVRDIPFVALCEAHLVPFSGVAHVGY